MPVVRQGTPPNAVVAVDEAAAQRQHEDASPLLDLRRTERDCAARVPHDLVAARDLNGVVEDEPDLLRRRSDDRAVRRLAPHEVRVRRRDGGKRERENRGRRNNAGLHFKKASGSACYGRFP